VSLASASKPAPNREFGNALDQLYRYIEDDFGKVNQVLLDRLESSVTLIPDLAGHLVNAGGKRIRSMLSLAAAKLCQYTGDKHLILAAAVEFIHTATLLHDDVIDESEKRRGLASAHTLWGNKASILVGDYLFSRAFSLMVESESLEILEILSSASSTIIEGEVMQLVSLGKIDLSKDAYLKVIESKTAQLFAASCQVGAVLGGQPQTHKDALRIYGLNLGTVFQLIDDVLDYLAEEKNLGKNIGDDFREGKITYPIIVAYQEADAKQKAFWHRTMIENNHTPEDLPRAIGYLKDARAFEKTMDIAKSYANRAKMALSVFPESEGKTLFNGLMDFCLQRGY